MIGHFNADELASFRAGTISGGKAARISAHLSSCFQCADVDSGLADVSQMLASVRVPAMSETLTQRLQSVIADEAAQRAVGWGLAQDRSPVLAPGRRAGRRPGLRTWSSSTLLLRSLAAAGVVVLLVGGGILLANQGGARPSGFGAGPKARPVNSRQNTGAVGSAPALTLRYRHDGQLRFAKAVRSDVDYTKKDLPTRIRHEVANAAQLYGPPARMPATSAAAEPQQLLNHTTVGQLESCLSAVAAGRPVLLVEVARYLGLPATIIVFKPVGNALDVIVVGEACRPSGQDVITTLTVPTK